MHGQRACSVLCTCTVCVVAVSLTPRRHMDDVSGCCLLTTATHATCSWHCATHCLCLCLRQIPAGSATAFSHAAASRRLLEIPFNRRARHLLAPVSSDGVLMLPPEPGTAAVGSLFTPPCATQLPCTSLDNVGAFVNTASETVVFQKCVALPKISTAADASVTGLVNDTLYQVTTVHTDLHGNQDTLSALVRTQDLTPPVLTVVETPPPDFNKFSVSVQLNEPGTVYAGLLLASNQGAVTATATCPPEFTARRSFDQSMLRDACQASQHTALCHTSTATSPRPFAVVLLCCMSLGRQCVA
jgi:hypothetical protein